MDKIRLALCQIDVTVGDIAGNLKKILKYTNLAKKSGVNIICFPELSITGYPPEDLLLKPSFIEENLNALEEVRKASHSITVIIGFADKVPQRVMMRTEEQSSNPLQKNDRISATSGRYFFMRFA